MGLRDKILVGFSDDSLCMALKASSQRGILVHVVCSQQQGALPGPCNESNNEWQGG